MLERESSESFKKNYENRRAIAESHGEKGEEFESEVASFFATLGSLLGVPSESERKTQEEARRKYYEEWENRRTAAKSHREEGEKFHGYVSSFWTATNSLLGEFDKRSAHEKKTWSTERPEQQVRLDLERVMSHGRSRREHDVDGELYDTPTSDSSHLMITYQRTSEKFVLVEEEVDEGRFSVRYRLALSDGVTTLVSDGDYALWQYHTNTTSIPPLPTTTDANAIPTNPTDVKRFLDVLQEIDIILKEEVKNVPLTRSLLRKLYETLMH